MQKAPCRQARENRLTHLRWVEFFVFEVNESTLSGQVGLERTE
jgi:hypothetical protein